MPAAPISAKPQSFYIRPAPGWLDLLFEEVCLVLKEPLQKYKFEPKVSILKSTVKVHRCDWRQGLELPLRLTTAHDVEWLLWESTCTSWSELEAGLKRVSWSQLGLSSGNSVHVSTGVVQGFTQSSAKLRDKLCQIAQVEHVSEGATIRLKMELRKDRLRVLVSLAGAPLYQRGYKKKLFATAPLPEHLASGCVKWTLSSFPKEETISTVWIPFAGSGTLGFETAIALGRLGTGSFSRHFAMEDFLATPKATLQHFRKKLDPSTCSFVLPQFVFTEINTEAMNALKENVASFPVKMDCRFEEGDFFERSSFVLPDSEKGNILVLLNPPFGFRLSKDSSVKDLYSRLGKQIKNTLGGFKGRVVGSCICPDELTWKTLIRELGVESFDTHHFTHGGEQMRLLRWRF